MNMLNIAKIIKEGYKRKISKPIKQKTELKRNNMGATYIKIFLNMKNKIWWSA